MPLPSKKADRWHASACLGSLHHGPFRLHLRADNWPLNQAGAIGLDAGRHYQF